MMQPLQLRHLTGTGGNGTETDRKGRLYDPTVRQALAQFGGREGIEPLETLAALRLAANKVHSAMERWAESHGLSESRLRVLTALYYSPERRRPIGELAELLGVVPRTMTDVVDVLERDGLIRRTPDHNDRRSVHAQLTESGLKKLQAIRKDAVGRQSALFASFKREQLAELRHLCLLLVKQLAQSQKGS